MSNIIEADPTVDFGNNSYFILMVSTFCQHIAIKSKNTHNIK